MSKGRKRNAKRNRTTAAGQGRLPPQEGVLRGAEALGVSVVYTNDGYPRLKKGIDVSMKATALGRLYARGHIEKNLLDAGEDLQRTAWAAFPNMQPRAASMERYTMPSRGDYDKLSPADKHARDCQKLYFQLSREMETRTSNAGCGVRMAVWNVCVNDRDPMWIDDAKLTPNDAHSRNRLKYGLEVLAELLGYTDKRYKHFEWDKAV